MNYDNLKITLELISLIITILGVPTAIYLYIQTKKKERQEREYLVYNSLDEKHNEFLSLCLQNADLNLYWGEDCDTDKLSNIDRERTLILYEILITNLERAYLLYNDRSENFKKKQWAGWKKYAEQWMQVKSFQKSWKDLTDDQYDLDFLKYMNVIHDDALKKSAAQSNNLSS